MKIEARHIQSILSKALNHWIIRSRAQRVPDLLGLSKYIANAINKDLVVMQNIADLKSTGVTSEEILLKGVTALEAEHTSTASYVDQAIAYQVGMCQHNMSNGPTDTNPIVTCAICGCILDEEMFGE